MFNSADTVTMLASSIVQTNHNDGKAWVQLVFTNETDKYQFLAKDRVGVSELTGNFFLFRGAEVTYLGRAVKRLAAYENEEIVPVAPGETFTHELCLNDYYNLPTSGILEVRYSASHPSENDTGIMFLRSMWTKLDLTQ